MSGIIIQDLYNNRGGRGGRGGGRGRGWGDRGRGRGGPPGRGKPTQDDYAELKQATQTNALDTISTKRVEGVGARYGFIPSAKPIVGLGRGAPIGQGAIHGLAPHGFGHGGRGGLPSSVPIPPGFYTPAKPAGVGMPLNGVLQGTPNQPPEAPVKATPYAKFTIPSPINTRGAPNVLRGQNIGRGGGRGFRGRWFKGANSPQEEETQSNNGNEASNGNWGGGGSRGGFAAFHRRGRGTVEGPESGGRGRGQFQFPFRGGARSGRGGAAPWGDRTAGERPPSWEQPVVDDLPPARDMWENVVGPAIAELTAPHVAVVDKPTKLEDFRCISSYTWRKGGRTPTLIAPGSPREWLDRALPLRVPFDNEIRMFHEDAFYMANESILIPLFRAVDAMALPTEPESAASKNADTIDWATVDFVTDRNNLRKLLRWIREPGPTLVSSPTGETSPTSPMSDGKPGSDAGAGTEMEWDPRRDFRIDLQLGGEKAVLMQRWAARTREVIVPPKGGCRANFEREHTAAARGCEDGAGHYRIVQYNIGGLKMVVRFEVDACIIGEVEATSPPHKHSARAEKVETCSDPVSNGVMRKSAESLARQSFTPKDEEAPWAGGNKEPPAPQPCQHIKPEMGPKAEEVESDKEAAPWTEGGHNSWDMPPEAPRSCKGAHAGSKEKEDGINQAPPSEDLDWDIPDDAAAWGIASDTAQDEETENPEMNGELTVVRAGTLLPQSAILELATRSIWYADRTSNVDTFLQIFLTQTPTHVIAIHQNGNFEKVIRQELESAEFTSIAEMEGVQRSIAQFVELLKEIQRLVKKHGTSGRLSLVCEKGKLELYGLAGEEGRLSEGELERFKVAV